jgi:hypothetical protein
MMQKNKKHYLGQLVFDFVLDSKFDFENFALDLQFNFDGTVTNLKINKESLSAEDIKKDH